jgi:hypothetical protein
MGSSRATVPGEPIQRYHASQKWSSTSQALQRTAAASAEDRRKLQLLLRLRLRELTGSPARPLKEIMDEIGRCAEARGLTPELLESLLSDE